MSKSTILYINSLLDRRPPPIDQLESNTWTTFLSNPIKSYSGKLKARLASIELSGIFYSFSEFENRFYFKDLTLNQVFGVSIPTNKYYIDGQQFVQDVNTIITGLGLGITFFYDIKTACLTVQNNRANPIRLVSSYIYDDEDQGSDCMTKLGFIDNYKNTSIAPTTTITGTSPFRLIRTNCCYLRCSLLSNNNVSSTNIPSPFYSLDGIIGKIPIGNYGNISQLLYPGVVDYNIGNQQVNSIQWSLLDEYYNPISTLGHPITFSVEFSFE